MSNDFMSAMKKTLNDEYNVAFTENGAAGYRTTGKSLLDLNFRRCFSSQGNPWRYRREIHTGFL